MNPTESLPQDAPAEEGWITLSSTHLVPWVLLASGFLSALVFAILPYGFPARFLLGWGFTLVHWTLGVLAFAAALQARGERPTGALPLAAFGLATAALGLRICSSLALQLAPRIGVASYTLWNALHPAYTILGLAALVLLLTGRREGGGGRFDGAVAALALAAGAGWLGLPVLAIGAMAHHPLLAAQWQALRNPGAALDGSWFDGLDEEQRQGNLGACSLTLALTSLALAGRLFLAGTRGHQPDATLAWGLAETAAVLLGALLLGIHVVRAARRTGYRRGRGPAVAAILLSGLPLLLLLAVALFLVLILTDVIPFRLF